MGSSAGTNGSSPQKSPEIQRVHEPDRQTMLAALRVVLGLPKQVPEFSPGDLLSRGSQSEAVSLTVENPHRQEETG